MVLLILPRQNGKNAVLEALEMYAFYVLGERRIIHTAQLAKTAADHMRRMVELVRASDDLEGITKVYWSNGKEALERTDTGARLEFITRGKKTARGGSPTRIVFDEALFLTDEQIQAILPAMSAQSMNADPPQFIYTSSAPLPESSVLHRVRTRGITGDAGRMFMAEWSCPENVDISTREALSEALHLSNPGLGIRIAEDYVIETELSTLSREAFLIERLGVVFASDGPSKVLGNWPACLDPGSSVPRVPVRLALSVGVGGTSAAFAVSGPRTDGLTHIEVTDHRPGTAWVVETAQRATRALSCPLTVDPRSPSSGLLADLSAAGVRMQQVTTAEYIEACARLQVEVANGKLRHIGQPELDAAVTGADIRPVGDGGWAWSRKSSAVDITPLEATTLAMWACATGKRKARFVNLGALLEEATT